MNLKKLTQAVFEGLPPEYRWAAVDADGEAHLYNRAPELSVANDVFGYFANFAKGDDYLDLGSDYDPIDWQNSLIERQDVPTADIDWSRQEIPAGATHYQRACAATKNTARYFKDDFNKAFVLTHPENGWIDFPKEVLTPEAYANMLAIPTTVFDLESSTYTIPRPESITDVARSIEAARIEEQACMPWPDGDARYFEISPIGQKHDASKPRYSLLPTGSVERVIDVLEFGATKYAPNNWRHVSDARTRYYDATMRHLSAWWQGEKYDAESGLHHLAHAACCILFLLWFERSAK